MFDISCFPCKFPITQRNNVSVYLRTDDLWRRPVLRTEPRARGLDQEPGARALGPGPGLGARPGTGPWTRVLGARVPGPGPGSRARGLGYGPRARALRLRRGPGPGPRRKRASESDRPCKWEDPEESNPPYNWGN